MTKYSPKQIAALVAEYGVEIEPIVFTTFCTAVEAALADFTIAVKRAMAGVMVRSYHDQYMAQGGGCADNIDLEMRAAFMTKSRDVQTKKGVRAEPALDTEALANWGTAIGLWNPRWEQLNPGMRRMNLANRVRSAVRKGAEIELKGNKLTA